MTTHLRAALAVTAAGLVVLVVALPLPLLSVSDPILGSRSSGFTGDDAVMAGVIVAIAAVVLLAGLLRRPVVLSWALLPVGLFTLWSFLVAADIEFGTTFLASDVMARLNESRSLAAGAWLTGLGLVLVVVGLAVPLLERWRVGVVR